MFEGLSNLLVEAWGVWYCLARRGLRENMWRRELRDRVDPDLLWSCARDQGMAIPESEVRHAERSAVKTLGSV